MMSQYRLIVLKAMHFSMCTMNDQSLSFNGTSNLDINLCQYLRERHMIQNVLVNFRASEFAQVKLSNDERIDTVLESYQTDLKRQYQIDNYYEEPIYDNVQMESNMSSKWHPVPANSNDEALFFTEKLKNNMIWIQKKAKSEDLCVPTQREFSDPIFLREWLEIAKVCVGITGIKGFIKTSNKNYQTSKNTLNSRWSRHSIVSTGRKTCRAQFKLKKHTDMKNTSFSHFPDRRRAFMCLAKLEGRLEIWWPSWIAAKAMPIAKTGLITIMSDEIIQEQFGSWAIFQKECPISTVLLALCCSVFSERKEFTTESQKQGGFTTHMRKLFDEALLKEPTSTTILGLLMPYDEIYKLIPREYVKRIYFKKYGMVV